MKNGHMETKIINLTENEVKENQIKAMLKKDTCFELFRDLDKKDNLF